MSARRRLERAFRAYVEGRDRGCEVGEKLDPSVEPSAEAEFGQVPSAPRFGVPVAEGLDFGRGPAARLVPVAPTDRSTDG